MKIIVPAIKIEQAWYRDARQQVQINAKNPAPAGSKQNASRPVQASPIMKVPLLLQLFCRSPFTLRLKLLEMLMPQKTDAKTS